MNVRSWETRFLDLAKLVASWSKDPSTKCGAVITREDRTIVSVGYNGFPRGMRDVRALYEDRDEKYSRVIHAEINALLTAREPVRDFTMYVYPFLPCDRCFVQMVQAGITTFIAPKATEEQLTRWGDAFNRVRRYALEMHIDVLEIPYE